MPSLSDILDLANLLLSAAVAVVAFSLLAYVVAYNVRNRVGRAFASLLAFVLIVYTGDVILYLVSPEQAELWLRLQWLGIPFVPAAYFDLSDALLQTTNLVSRRRTRLVMLSYLVSTAISGLALFTDLIVQGGETSGNLFYLDPGPLFPVFVAYFFFTSGYGLYNTYRVRQRCLTPASRRRMTYLMVSFIAPGLGVFPYLVLAGFTVDPSGAIISILTLIGNVGVMLMLVVMAYSVAYYGVLSPDRVVKRGLIVFLIRGPLLGILVVGAILTVPKVESIFGLPRESVVLLVVVALIVLLQLLIELIKPTVDRMIYSHDQEELMAIRELDRRLLTSSDLRQFLENVLVALCEYLRVPGGFVAVQVGDELLVEAACGPNELIGEFKRYENWQTVLHQATTGHGQGAFSFQYNGYWVWPLRTRGKENALGLMGVVARPGEAGPDEDEQAIVGELVARAATALEDRLLQQGVFMAVMEIMPQIERVQRWRSVVPYVGTPTLQQPADTSSILYQPEFTKWVKDALSHYWGGPKLTDSRLLELKIVNRAAEQEGGSPTKGLRAVLAQAIEDLRPEGQRQMTASEWLLYNILELKFIQGKPVREIADRLSMSESDLYRKQRVAIEQVALKIAELEAGKRADEERSDEVADLRATPPDVEASPASSSTRKAKVAKPETTLQRR